MDIKKVEEYFRDLRSGYLVASEIPGDIDPEKIHAMKELRKHVRDINLLVMALNSMGVYIEFTGEADRLSIKSHQRIS